jgi:hypothetical protein
MGALGVRLLVDTGVDDALGLVAAVLHPRLELVEAIAVAGNVGLGQALTNTRFVLGRLGAGAVPVTAGAARRADGQPYVGREVHGPDGLAGVVGPSDVVLETEPVASPLALADADAVLVCLGPLTTLMEWPPGQVLATYARPGEANHELDPDAAQRVRAAWQLRDGSVLTDAVPAVDWRPRTGLGRLVAALLDHQAARGAGLGDADTVLRLAGESRPAQALIDVVRTWESVRT